MPRGECRATSPGFLALRLVVSLPGGQMGAGVGKRWVSSPWSLQAASGWPPLKASAPEVAPLPTEPSPSLPSSNCFLLAPLRGERIGSLAFSSRGCTCGFHTPVLPLFKNKTPCTAPSSSNPNLSVIYSSGILTDSVPSEAAEYIQV